MKKEIKTKDIQLLVEQLNLRVQDLPVHSGTPGLLGDIEKECVTARHRHRLDTSIRQSLVSAFSIAVIIFCVAYNLHNDDRCGYALDGNPLYSTLSIDRIDRIFA